MDCNNKSFIESVVLSRLKLVLVLPAFIFIFNGYAAVKEKDTLSSEIFRDQSIGRLSAGITSPKDFVRKVTNQMGAKVHYYYHLNTETESQIDEEAFRWLKEAAEQGDADAQYTLGLMYYNGGQRVTQSYEKAFHWFEKAAYQGEVDAQYSLGVMYRDGHGVDQDYAAAISWFTEAAEQDNADAHFNLGVMYLNGQGAET